MCRITNAGANSFGTWDDLNQDGMHDFATGRADCCVQEGMVLHYANSDGSFNVSGGLDYDYNPYMGEGKFWTSIWTVGKTSFGLAQRPQQTRIFAHRQLEGGVFAEYGEEFGLGYGMDGSCCPILLSGIHHV